jgi:hypothetical protein
MPTRLGIEFPTFRRCCRAVATVLRYETGYEKLHFLGKYDTALRFQARHNTLAEEKLCSEFLYSVMRRGVLRASEQSWHTYLCKFVEQQGAKDPAHEVDTFINRFTRLREIDHDLEPCLFYKVDQRTLVLDLLLMPNFFECCLRKVTSVDDAPDPAARRGTHFERAAWTLLSRALPVRLAIPLNKRLRRGPSKGE